MTESSIVIEELTGLNKAVKNIRISGQLDESNVDEKIQVIYKIFETTPKGVNMIFDLENLDYMNSKSIGYLTDLYGKVTESGGTVAIAKPKPNITDILQVVGLTQLIKTFDSMEEAKKYINENGSATTEAAIPTAPVTPVITTPVVTTPAPVTPVVTTTATPVVTTIPAPTTPITPAPVAPVIPTTPMATTTPVTPAPVIPTPATPVVTAQATPVAATPAPTTTPEITITPPTPSTPTA